jgi:hypothetical protein
VYNVASSIFGVNCDVDGSLIKKKQIINRATKRRSRCFGIMRGPDIFF